MRGPAYSLLLFYLVITILWINNSKYLFSLFGVIVWLISIGLGSMTYLNLKKKTMIKLPLLYAILFMVFLLILSGLIELAVNSMP